MVKKEESLDNITLFSVITIMSFILMIPTAIFMEGIKFTPYLHAAGFLYDIATCIPCHSFCRQLCQAYGGDCVLYYLLSHSSFTCQCLWYWNSPCWSIFLYSEVEVHQSKAKGGLKVLLFRLLVGDFVIVSNHCPEILAGSF